MFSMSRRPKNELAALARAARAQLERATMLGKSLDLRLKEKVKTADVFTLDEDSRRDFQSITTTIRDAGSALIKAMEGNKKNLGELTEAQLTAQFQAEIVLAAGGMSDEDWQRMVDARAKAGR